MGFLKRGLMIAVLRLTGTWPVSRETLIMVVIN